MKLMLDLQGAQTLSRFRGIGRHSRALAKAIVRQAGNHEVFVLLNAMLRDNIEDLRADFLALLPRDHILSFLAVGPVAAQNAENDWRMRASELEREAFVARHAPDVVHVGSLFEGFLDDAVVSIGELDAAHRTAVTLFDLIPLLNPDKYLVDPGYTNHYLRRAQAMKRADLLLALSESSRREAVETLHIQDEQITVIGCGVDDKFRPVEVSAAQAEVLQLRLNIPKPFILYVGAVDPRKNIEILIDAFSHLSPACKATHCLVVAGALQPVEQQRVRALSARYGLRREDIVFCGHVSDSDLILMYNLCALFVFPSRHEGFGLPVLEAMACGAPVLAANATSLPEVVGRSDLLFNPDDAEGLAGKMVGILSERGQRAALRKWGVERAAGFTWAECASRAVTAFEALHARQRDRCRASGSLSRRPKLAFLSPLPEDRTGVATYSAELLPELARYYDIDCIINDAVVTDGWIKANYALRDVEWFERNAVAYDRIVYSFGNSHYHAWMCDLLRQFPGIVVLHDFFLGHLLEWMSTSGKYPPDCFLRELYLTHGLKALVTYRDAGPARAVVDYACNGLIFRNATGILVHSEHAARSAEDVFGPSVRDRMAIIPHLRSILCTLDRAAARARLGIGRNDFLVCSFGFVTALKQSGVLLDAWASSVLREDARASLVFVGAAGSDPASVAFTEAIAALPGPSRVTVTGYASANIYRDYLAAADVAVQLRRHSRGETSGAILDCLAAGIPVVVNAHGPAAELPSDVVKMLPDNFDVATLSKVLEDFHHDRAAASALGDRGRRYLSEHHHPAHVGAAFHEAIERLSDCSYQAQQRVVLSALAEQHSVAAPADADIARFAMSLSRNSPKLGLRQILCDVTVLAEQDAKTGIQRVVRAVLTMLIDKPPPGFRIEPVRVEGGHFIYARSFTEKVFGIPAAVVADAEVDYGWGDIFLGLDWVPDRLPDVVGWLDEFRGAGGKAIIMIYDLLPLITPQFFPPFMVDVAHRWFEAGLAVADQFICISRTVADDVARFSTALGELRSAPLAIDYFRMGGDLAASQPTRGLPPNAASILTALKNRASFVMVGTVEPRKGHRQVLDAFNLLWQAGTDVGLVIVGKRGWMVDDVVNLIEHHVEHGKRLFWLQEISDEMLDSVYAASKALIAASFGEGFGLPLIEAAQHGVPVIARDIPVFREVAGDYGVYFKGKQPEDLVRVVHDWLDAARTGRSRRHVEPRLQTWRAAVDELTRIILGPETYLRLTFHRDDKAADMATGVVQLPVRDLTMPDDRKLPAIGTR